MVEGPITPFKSEKDAQVQDAALGSRPSKEERKELNKTDRGLFASPVLLDDFESSLTGVSPVLENTSKSSAGQHENLMAVQFATPSPFPIRTKRARSAASSEAVPAHKPSDATPQSDRCHASGEADAAAGSSPVAAFPDLSSMGPLEQSGAAPRAQRDLFGSLTGIGALSEPPSKAAEQAIESLATLPRKQRGVVAFGELVAEGLLQQQQRDCQQEEVLQSLADDSSSTSSDEDEGLEQPLQEENPKLRMPAIEEQCLGKVIAHYASKVQ